MAARCGSLRLPLLPSTPSAPSSSSSGTLRVRSLPNRRKRPSGHRGEKGTAVCGASAPARAYLGVEDVQQKCKSFKDGAALLKLYGLVADAARAALSVFKTVAEGRRGWALQAEKIVESAVIKCRFFTLIAVAGTLVGSILCFVEGCFLVMEAFFENLHAVWGKLDEGEVMSLLVEAMDMFLVGSSMLHFGMGIYIMFVGSKGTSRNSRWLIPVSKPNAANMLQHKMFQPCTEIRCISEAKAKLGHAVLMMLQAGFLDKFKGVPLTSGLDLACFAGAVLVSSAGMFLLSRLYIKQGNLDEKGTDQYPQAT